MGGICKSCGCLKKENQEKIRERLHRVDGTCVEFLEKRKYRKDNKSGFRGVFCTPSGKYRVSIGFRGKRIYLGVYNTFEEAVAARKKGEEEIHGGFLREYRAWEQKAKEDPQSAGSIHLAIRPPTKRKGAGKHFRFPVPFGICPAGNVNTL